jgi:hypothetical protein
MPQGAVLSLKLFNILTDVQLVLFSDDSALLSTHAKADVIIDRLQSASMQTKDIILHEGLN